MNFNRTDSYAVAGNIFMNISSLKLVFGTCLLLSAIGCSNPQPGPDKTALDTTLGASWGAGAGAVIGNQVGSVGPGVAVGAGFGALSGLISGANADLAESALLDQKRELAALRLQNISNADELGRIQRALDGTRTTGALAVYQVFFDADSTSLRSGSISNLENIADSIKRTTGAIKISVQGHSDDAGTPEYNEKLAESRARSVASYLGARGISMDQIEVKSFGSTRPLATNSTPVGQQLNRRVEILISNG